MAVVLLPGLLAQQAGGQRRFEVDGPTLEHALRALPVADLVLDEGGALRPLVNAYVDGTDARAREGLHTAVAEATEIRIVAAIAGG